ncbi:MAG: DUF427 domain-containing protein [Armatimonadetes bacterium]|nr:DUF427 domain-containing protein [Armatimonadota bacterium]
MKKEIPGPGQESVWEYPRPPRLQPVRERIRVVIAGETVVDVERGLRVLEIGHPPVYYVRRGDVRDRVLQESDARPTFCEFKGVAHYWDAVVKGERSRAVAWSYLDPVPQYLALRDYVAFDPSRVEACFLGDDKVTPVGGYYGGWITSRVVGPFYPESGSDASLLKGNGSEHVTGAQRRGGPGGGSLGPRRGAERPAAWSRRIRRRRWPRNGSRSSCIRRSSARGSPARAQATVLGRL